MDERFFLLDCGEGTQIQLRKYSVRFSKITHIFISHLHGDHIYGLPGLISSFSLLRRTNPLYVYAFPELKKIMGGLLKNLSNNLTFELVLKDIRPNYRGVLYEDDTITVNAFPLLHSIPATGFRFIEKPRELNIRKEMIDKYNIPLKEIVKIKQGADFITQVGTRVKNDQLTLKPFKQRTIAYCSDTAYTTSFIEDISHSDILYHEATFLHKDLHYAEETMHSTALQAARIAAEAGAGKLLLGHFSARYKETDELEAEARSVFPESYCVDDGQEFEIEQVRDSS
jgi:ribonuclease Z